MNDFLLTDKHIFITGASSGIGRQCAIQCSKAGATVTITGRDEGRLHETLAKMENPSTHLLLPLELSEYKAMQSAVATSVLQTGKIHGLINCAGISTILPIKSVSVDKRQEFIQANVYTSYQLTREISRKANFSPAGGSIIFISSVMAEVGQSGRSLYGMTKGALVAASKSLAIELAKRNIRVNCISPGVVATPMSAKSAYQQDELTLQQVVNAHPLGLGKPEDIANSCIFLLSNAARWITGSNLVVDGGYMAK